MGENEKNSDRDRERKNINTSLLTLGRVISMLRNSEAKKGTERIPYRDSKLTRLLQVQSIHGWGRTLCTFIGVPELGHQLTYGRSLMVRNLWEDDARLF